MFFDDATTGVQRKTRGFAQIGIDVVVGEGGRYGVVRNGTTRDAIERVIGADDLAVLHG